MSGHVKEEAMWHEKQQVMDLIQVCAGDLWEMNQSGQSSRGQGVHDMESQWVKTSYNVEPNDKFEIDEYNE